MTVCVCESYDLVATSRGAGEIKCKAKGKGVAADVLGWAAGKGAKSKVSEIY